MFGDTRGTQDAKAVHTVPVKDVCDCGARRVDQQLGLEVDPRQYLARMVEVFAEVRRVLRDDGTLWVNMGDCYTDGGRGKDTGSTLSGGRETQAESRKARNREDARPFGLGPKQLVGMPWRLALALQDDGWILRSDIIWHKPNPMPESVSDRPTKSHEYLFFFSKRPRYYYDRDAIVEPVSGTAHHRGQTGVGPKGKVPAGWAAGTGRRHEEKLGRYGGVKQNESFQSATRELVATRNKRTVWTVLPRAFKGAHFATFPPLLITPCVLAGTSTRACEMCGAAWRMIYSEPVPAAGLPAGNKERAYRQDKGGPKDSKKRQAHAVPWKPTTREVIGSEPGCECTLATGSARCVVLDPFGGAGTTALVAEQLGRDSILIELSPAYAKLARERLGIAEATA